MGSSDSECGDHDSDSISEKYWYENELQELILSAKSGMISEILKLLHEYFYYFYRKIKVIKHG